MKTMKKILILAAFLITANFVNAQSWVNKFIMYNGQLNDVAVIDANTAVAVGGYGLGTTTPDGVVYKTTNGGITWTAQTENTSNILIAVDFPNATTGYAVGVNGTILKTIDGGANWNSLSSPIANDLYDVCFVDANTGYASGVNGNILKTVDGGSSWTQIPTGSVLSVYSLFFMNANTGWISSGSSVLKTTNGGSTWTPVTTNSIYGINDIWFCDANTGYVACPDMIVKTTDGGQTYIPIYNYQTTEQVNAFWFANSQTGWGVCKGGQIIKTTDGGANWTSGASGNTVDIMGVDFYSTTKGYAVGMLGQTFMYGNFYSVTFHVTDNFSNALSGASVTFNYYTQTTNATGNTTFTNVLGGTYSYTVSSPGYATYNGNVTEPGNDPVQVQLQPASTGFSVNFHIKDNLNLPVFNALVTFKGLTYNTDVNGLVTFNNVPAGNNQSYSVAKTGYTTISSTTDVNSNQTLNLTMNPPAASTYDITFHVTDNSSVDLTGASVTFDGTTKTSDASGQAIFNGISTGNRSYAVNMAGYDPASGSTNVTGNATVDVSLVTTVVSYAVGVTVYDNTSTAISGASVTFDGVTQTTDPSGYTQFTGVPAGNIHYIVSNAGYITVDDYVNEPGNDPVIVYMTAVSSGSDIDFNVYDDASNPIDGASVTFNGITQTTDVSGYTQFTGVPSGDITYEVVKAGYITASGNVTEPGTNPVIVNMTAVGSGLTINFYVYDLYSNHIDGATVTFNGVTQYTDVTGTATFNDVPTGNLYYEISKVGYISTSGNINEPGNDPIMIYLTPAATGLDVNFWVYDNQSNPISGASVHLNGVPQTTDASGNTVFHDVATGNLYYEVNMAGYYTIYNYIDEPGNDPVIITLSLIGAAYNITFNVEDEYGDPVENATVTFNLTDQSTAVDGSTEYSGIAEGDNYWYNVVKSGYVLSTGYFNVHADVAESVILFHDAAGLNEINTSVQIAAYPNPVKDEVNISSSEKIKGIKVFNSTGQKIIDAPVDDTNINIDFKSFLTGLYIFQVQTENNIISKKIIKEQ
jgi:photosystem II stability/assembly factor-like uncharacterized protein